MHFNVINRKTLKPETTFVTLESATWCAESWSAKKWGDYIITDHHGGIVAEVASGKAKIINELYTNKEQA